MKPLEQLLRGIREKTLAVILTLTEPEMTARSEAGDRNPFVGRLRKRTRQSCYLCSHYATAVNDQRAREGKPADFRAKPRVWGRPVEGTPLVEHNGQLYLRYQVDQVDQVLYEVDGITVPESLVEPWLKVKAKSSRQGLEDEVVIRLVKLSNLVNVELKR